MHMMKILCVGRKECFPCRHCYISYLERISVCNVSNTQIQRISEWYFQVVCLRFYFCVFNYVAWSEWIIKKLVKKEDATKSIEKILVLEILASKTFIIKWSTYILKTQKLEAIVTLIPVRKVTSEVDILWYCPFKEHRLIVYWLVTSG